MIASKTKPPQTSHIGAYSCIAVAKSRYHHHSAARGRKDARNSPNPEAKDAYLVSPALRLRDLSGGLGNRRAVGKPKFVFMLKAAFG